PKDTYDIVNEIPFSLPPPLSIDVALEEAMEQRADLKSAAAQVVAAERARAAARAERLPSFSVGGDYGVVGVNPAQSHGTFSLIGTLRIPIWEGGRTEGDIGEAEAALAQRRAELADLRGKIESDVRNAFLDMQAAESQVSVAEKNLEVNQETLILT